MINLQDFALQDRQLFIAGTPTRATNEQKRIQAIQWMGPLYVFHPKNRVTRLAEPLPEVFSWKPSKVLGRKRK